MPNKTFNPIPFPLWFDHIDGKDYKKNNAKCSRTPYCDDCCPFYVHTIDSYEDAADFCFLGLAKEVPFDPISELGLDEEKAKWDYVTSNIQPGSDCHPGTVHRLTEVKKDAKVPRKAA